MGYIKDNIQLVVKDINMMKQGYSQEHFIELCRYVTENIKINFVFSEKINTEITLISKGEVQDQKPPLKGGV